MNTSSDTSNNRSGDAVENLLRQAAPRPSPPASVEQEVRDAVRSEWQAVSSRRRRRNGWRNIAAAATVLLAVVVTLNNLRDTTLPPVEVASLDQSRGTLYVQGGDTDATEAAAAAAFSVGQVLQTGDDSAAGLDWLGGGSLRVDAETRLEFTATNEIYLHRGRIYFDSQGEMAASGLTVRTEHGVVSHVGTQFMTAKTRTGLVVSVREGEVLIDGAAHSQKVRHGQRAELAGGGRPVITNTTGVGAEWEWVETISPAISVDGMSAYDFLQWVSQETGYVVRFANEDVRRLAQNTTLKGAVNAPPREELRLRMMTMDLTARFDPEGPYITISD